MALPTVAVVGAGRLEQQQVRARLLALSTGPPAAGWVPGPPVVAESSDAGRSPGLLAPSPDPVSPPGTDQPAAEVPDSPLGGFQARALASAVAAYTAAHGHPLEVEPFVDGVEGRRWATRGRVAAVAAAALLVLGAVVVLRAVQETPSVVVPAAATAATRPRVAQRRPSTPSTNGSTSSGCPCAAVNAATADASARAWKPPRGLSGTSAAG